MYPWGGTLTPPDGAYNAAMRWEGEPHPRRRSRHCFSPAVAFDSAPADSVIGAWRPAARGWSLRR